MPAFTKPPADLVDIFKRAIAQIPGVEARQMFGYPAGLRELAAVR